MVVLPMSPNIQRLLANTHWMFTHIGYTNKTTIPLSSSEWFLFGIASVCLHESPFSTLLLADQPCFW